MEMDDKIWLKPIEGGCRLEVRVSEGVIGQTIYTYDVDACYNTIDYLAKIYFNLDPPSERDIRASKDAPVHPVKKLNEGRKYTGIAFLGYRNGTFIVGVATSQLNEELARVAAYVAAVNDFLMERARPTR